MSLGYAAGVLLSASVLSQIIPETHRKAHLYKATFGLTNGLVLMLCLDVWPG